MARLARLIFVWLGLALAVWLLPASIHIVDWTADGPARVALFAPQWQLWLVLAAAAIAVLATGVRHRGSAATVSSTVGPLALWWLWVIPYLPWLPDRAPALLAMAGPLRWGIAALAVGGFAWLMLRDRVTARVPLPGRRTACSLSLAFYLVFGLWSARDVGPGADEPHYLVITQSLLRDRDLAIENNHTRGDYREYFGGELRPDFLRRGLNDVIYSIHAPGLPALLVPAYAAGGYLGAVVMLCLFSALAALAVFDLARLLAGHAAAWLTWATVCLTVPFVPHSWLIFPEMPGALIVAWAALWLYAPLPARPRTWLWRGAALAVLPWLHTKFVILLAAMTAALFVRIWKRQSAAAALVAAPILSGALWLFFFYRLYGVFDPQIPYGDFPTLYVLFANIPRGVLGLLFDQKFGLLIYAPVYLLAIAGGWLMLRRAGLRWFATALLLIAAGFVASSTRMYMWWGGSSAPARFLVPILPLIAPLVAVAWRDVRRAPWRATFALLLLVSVAVAAAGVVSPRRFMLFSAPHGLANLAEAARGGSPLPYLLPTFTEGAVRAPLGLLAPWVIAALLAAAVAFLISRLSPRSGGLTAASAGLMAFVVVGSVLAGAPVPETERRAAAVRGRLDLMRAYDGAALRGFDYAHGAPLNDRQLLDLGAIRVARADATMTTDSRRIAGPFDLAAGRFTTRVTFAGEPPYQGTIAVLLGDAMTIARADASRLAPLAFDLPVDATVWVAVEDGALAASARQVTLVAESIVPKRARPAIEVRSIDPIDDRPGAFIVYADEDTYPEGGVFWTRGTGTGRVFVAPAGASTLVLTVHLGPAAGAVRLRVDGQDRSLTLSRDQTRQIEIPIAPGARLIPVVVEAPGSFRPSDHEPGSADRRSLGCQIRIGLR